jgi:hypothetical protein
MVSLKHHRRDEKMNEIARNSALEKSARPERNMRISAGRCLFSDTTVYRVSIIEGECDWQWAPEVCDDTPTRSAAVSLVRREFLRGRPSFIHAVTYGGVVGGLFKF